MNEDTKAGLYGLKWLTVAGVVLLTIVVIVFGIRYFTADIRGEGAKRELVEANGALRVQAYDKFFDQCAAVQTKEDQVRSLDDEAALPQTTDQRRGEIAAFRSGLVSQRAELIRQYNADSAKTYTSGQFKASNLPYQLDPTTEETSCTL